MRGLAVKDKSSLVLSLLASYTLRAATLPAVRVLFTAAGILEVFLEPCQGIIQAVRAGLHISVSTCRLSHSELHSEHRKSIEEHLQSSAA